MPVVGRAAVLANTSKYRQARRKIHGGGRRSSGSLPGSARSRRNSQASPEEDDQNIGCYDNARHNEFSLYFRGIRDSKWFQPFIIAIIFLAGALVGIQTYPIEKGTFQDVLGILDTIVLIIFVIEIFVKIFAEGKYPHNFFKDGWNVFDFIIVVVGLLPIGGNAVTALRMVRLLRVLKLVRALPKLRILVMGLLKSLSSIAYIGLLLLLLFYLYAVVGVSFFGKNDPVQLGNLHISLLTLFRCATLEDWTDVMYIAMEGCDNYGYEAMPEKCVNPQALPLPAVLYFVSFVVLSAMMILNLFIGVITSSMQDAKSDLSEEAENEEQQQQDEEEALLDHFMELGESLRDLSQDIEEMSRKERERKGTTLVKLSNKDLLGNQFAVRNDDDDEDAKVSISVKPVPRENDLDVLENDGSDASNPSSNG